MVGKGAGMGVAKRLAEAVAAGRAAVRAAEGGQVTGAGTAPKPARGRVALLALGQPPEAVLAAVRAMQAAGEPAILLVTDARRVDLYQIAGVVTEHLPPELERGGAARRRLSHLVTKWAVRRCDALDAAAAELARACREDHPILEVNLLASAG